MQSPLQKLVRAAAVAGLSLIAAVTVSAQDETPGIVRITKPFTAPGANQQVMPASFGHSHRAYMGGQYQTDCQYGSGQACPDCYQGHSCRHPRSQAMIDYMHCKFGYFIPTGAGGAGVPLCGKYARVYPDDPYYFDQRDGQAWGAQGYGIPMAVPLAPTVGHAYNYGWGTPSSRLTPVSRPAY
jgi:hypothetical protein